MEDIKLKNLWASYEEKFMDNYKLIENISKDVTQLKIQSFLSSMKPIKIFTLLMGILWVLVGGIALLHVYVHAFSEVSLFFLFSASIQIILTAIAVIIYLYQLVLLYQVDLSMPVIKAQKTLIHLKASTLWVTRILFLQLPVWTTFYLNPNMLFNANIYYLIFQGMITTVFVFIAVWLFLNIKFENRNKKWFRMIFNDKEWSPIINSIDLIKQLEDFKEEEKNG